MEMQRDELHNIIPDDIAHIRYVQSTLPHRTMVDFIILVWYYVRTYGT